MKQRRCTTGEMLENPAPDRIDVEWIEGRSQQFEAYAP